MATTTGTLREVERSTPDAGSRVAFYVKRTVFVVLLLICTVIFLAPLVWLISVSLKVRSEVFCFDFLPVPVSWENYVRVWNAAPLFSWLKNSVIVGVLAAGAVTLSSSLIAFGFSSFRF